MEPSEDPTPLRTTIPDHAWFPCPHCGRAIKCPPVARPVSPATTALTRKPPLERVAPELIPDPRSGDTTVILPPPTLPPEAPGT